MKNEGQEETDVFGVEGRYKLWKKSDVVHHFLEEIL